MTTVAAIRRGGVRAMTATDEVALLRSIAANPYDRVRRAAYADWLDEDGRSDEATTIRRAALARSPSTGNFMTVEELVGKLLEFPLDVVVLYRACSDWSELEPDEVRLVKAEDKKIIFREQNRYSDYHEYSRYRPDNPQFVTVVTLPGN